MRKSVRRQSPNSACHQNPVTCHSALADELAGLLGDPSGGAIHTPAALTSLNREIPRAADVCDIIYIPGETPLLKAARERGNRTINGLGMLLHQGRPAWRSWFDREVEVTRELRALIEATI